MPVKKRKPKAKRPQPAAPRSHHLDRRADLILAASNGDDDELLTTQQVAQWFRISEQWLEIARSRGYTRASGCGDSHMPSVSPQSISW